MELLRQYVPLLLLLNNVGAALIVWAVRRASKDDVAKVDKRAEEIGKNALHHATEIEKRVIALEQLGKLLPTREDLHLLRIEMMESRGQVNTLVKELEGDRRQFTAETQAVRVYMAQQMEATEKLVQRAENNTRMITEHLLNRGK